MTLHGVSTFSGVGGLDLAFHRAGVSNLLMCELDKAAQPVLAHHFPGIPIHDDVRELTGDDLRAAGAVPDRTVLHGGFPCQDLSIAGRRRGMGHGTRSGLFFELDRLMAEFAPRWIVLENVPGILSSNGGRDMGAVLGSLADRGYGFAYRVLDARYFGVPQRRRRVVIVGRLGDSGAAPAQVLLEPEGCGGNPAPSQSPRACDQSAAAGGTGVPRIARTLTAHHGRHNADETLVLSPDVAATLTAGRQQDDYNLVSFAENQRSAVSTSDTVGALSRGGGKPGQGYPAVLDRTGIRILTPLERERLQGFPDGWTDVRQSGSARCQQIGNSVAVPLFEWVARRLVAVDAALRVAAA